MDEERYDHTGSQQIRQHEEHIGKYLRGGFFRRMDIVPDEASGAVQKRIRPETTGLKAAHDRKREWQCHEVIREEADAVLPEAPVIDDAEDVFERAQEYRCNEEGDQSKEGTDQHPKLDRQVIKRKKMGLSVALFRAMAGPGDEEHEAYDEADAREDQECQTDDAVFTSLVVLL